MTKVFEILKDVDNDRYVFVHIDKSKYADGICGLNFHQGDTEIVWAYAEPNVHLTEIWRRLTLKYPHTERVYLIEKAIDLYIIAFIH